MKKTTKPEEPIELDCGCTIQNYRGGDVKRCRTHQKEMEEQNGKH